LVVLDRDAALRGVAALLREQRGRLRRHQNRNRCQYQFGFHRSTSMHITLLRVFCF